MPTGFELVAGDHDFHVVNSTPGVTLPTEVKANLDGSGKMPSFYKGMQLPFRFHYPSVIINFVCGCIVACRDCPCLFERLDL